MSGSGTEVGTGSTGGPARKPFARPAGTVISRPRSGSSDAPRTRKPPRSTNASPAAKGRPLSSSQTPARPTSAGAPGRIGNRRTLSAPLLGAARPATRPSSTSRGSGADTTLPPGRLPSGVGSRGGAPRAAARRWDVNPLGPHSRPLVRVCPHSGPRYAERRRPADSANAGRVARCAYPAFPSLP